MAMKHSAELSAIQRPLGLTVLAVALAGFGLGAAAGTVAFAKVHLLLALGSAAYLVFVVLAVIGIWRMAVWAPLAVSAWSVIAIVNVLIFQFTIGQLPGPAFLATVALFVIFLQLLRRYVERKIVLGLE